MQWTVKQKSFTIACFQTMTWTCLEPCIALLNSVHSYNIYTKRIHLNGHSTIRFWVDKRAMLGRYAIHAGGCAGSPKIFKCAESLVMPWLDTLVCLSPSPLKFWKTWKKRSCISRIGPLKEFFAPSATLPQWATETNYIIARDAIETVTVNAGAGLK